MRAARLLSTFGILVVLVLAVVVVGLLTMITARALPQTAGSLRVAGLEQPVTITRDLAGIVQITADTPHDLFLAQGYVHAQERLWQMEVWRRIGAGRMSELFGKSQVPLDSFIRTLDWRGAAARDLELASPRTRSALEAYAAGVNAYLDTHRGSLGLAFVVAGALSGVGSGTGGYDPEPWTVLDSATWQKVQAFQLGGNYATEIFRMLADARLGSAHRTDELFAPYAADMPVITPSGLVGSGGAGASLPAAAASTSVTAGDTSPSVSAALAPGQAAAWREVAALRAEILSAAGIDAGGGIADDHGIGSNNWVVAPSKSATGGALLASDPHLGLSMPSVWFMNGLRCRVVSEACPYDVTGVSFPGNPFVLLGHNARIAWGATNAGPDVMDLFIETVDPTDPGRYRSRGSSVPFSVRTEIIKVANGDPVTIQVRSTNHGPIINDLDSRLRDDPRPMALRWAATSQADTTLDAIRELNIATDYAGFRAALAKFGAPSQNFAYADVDGHIGYQLPGLIPIRPGKDDGRRPVDGASGEHDWTGYIRYDDLPRQLDPAAGIIVTANNATVDSRYPFLIGTNPDPGHRAQRALDLLAAAGPGGITPDEMRAIQVDNQVPRAARLTARLGDPRPATDDGQALLDLVRSWDGRCEVESRGCAAYMTFELALLRAIFDDDLGPLARDWLGSAASWQPLLAVLGDPASAWWDDVTTPDRERAETVISRSLDRAGAQLRAALGAPRAWQWGQLHKVAVQEATLGGSKIGPLEWYFNRPAFALAGAYGAINNMYYRPSRAYPDPADPAYQPLGIDRVFWVTNGPSYRLTIDMRDLDGARIVQSSGQSGNPFDRHYGDLVTAWARGGTVPLPFSQAAVQRSTVATLTLTP